MSPIKYKKFSKTVADPKCKTEYSAGIDLAFNIKTAAGYTLIPAGESISLNLGVGFQIPVGWVGLAVPRSSLGKLKVRLDNTVGVIDADFVKEMWAFITNTGREDVFIEDNEYFIQMVIVPHYPVFDNLEEVDELVLPEGSSRTGGIGSTGKH